MKKTMIIIVCVLSAVAVLVGGVLLLRKDYNDVHLIQYERQIILSDGVPEPAMTKMDFDIEEDKDYKFWLNWELPEPGILNGIRIVNGQGETMFACTGDWARIESKPIYLETGRYTLETYYLTSKESFVEFCNLADMELESDEEGEYEYASEGQWNIKYKIKIADVFDNTRLVATLMGGIVGILLVIILLAISKTSDSLKGNYDERQQMVRGKGYKYAFFAIMICNMLFVILNMLEIPLFSESEVALFVSAMIGVGVLACYCVWNDGYFALNDNQKRLSICFAFIGIFNTVIGITNFCEGKGFVNGSFTIQSINLFCAIMAWVVLITVICKHIKERREE